MTLKQIDGEIKRAARRLEDAKRNDAEMMQARGFSAYGKEIEYFAKRVQDLRAARPEIERAEIEKMLAKIAAQQIKDKASTIGFIQKGNDIHGVTPGGAKWVGVHNWYGYTDRTRHCYTLYINAECIFTSGTIDTVLATVAQN